MHPVLALTLQAMQSDMSRMDRVAMNLANSQTPGYKREVAAGGFAQLLEAQGAALVHIDQRQGTMKPTGQGLDVALSGPGWFEVATDQGIAYTRMGSFRRDSQGRLVTEQGHPVAGTAGEIRLPEGPVSIDAAGRIFEAVGGEGGFAKSRAEPVAQLKVVVFEEKAPAQRLGNGLVVFPGATAAADGRTEIRQGHLENANASSMQEMVQLMQTVRHFESMQKVALGYDEMLGNAIRKLGEGQ
ncbi:flagellar hook basal-body protein [Ramlibacter sp. XY19]|uniref:flagellar hook-basal body protein n=1 Tax=Ramlibacter paludis TaxID=2908000 RepID=UPI0023DBA2EA|nr:flagellar hook basal-body protein [Ramlibacter paludis]MCG2594942.1 flagellar hook basal-body protein [Ramlibacter paludis]